MPIKIEKGRRWVEMDIDLPGTPEQVWRAMATGEGMTAWFIPCSVEEREGGAIRFLFGDGIETKGKVVAWEPPHRFVYDETNWSGEAPPIATEILIEAKAGGVCRMRMTHSLFSEKDDWDKEIESFEKGWPSFFNVLRLYLAHFPDQPAATARPTTPYDGSVDAAWDALLGALGLVDAKTGERRDARAGRATPLSGIVAHIGNHAAHKEMILRLSAPTSGVALFGVYHWGGATRIAISFYFYGDDVAVIAAREDSHWQAWLRETFPAPA